MKQSLKSILIFAFLGALTGACMPLFLGTRPAVTYGLPYWLDDYFSPVAVLLSLTIPYGVVLGALTGLASTFSSGRFGSARCLLAITVPALLAMAVVAPHTEKNFEDPQLPMWTSGVVGAMVAFAMAVLLAYLGQRRMRSR